MLKDLFFFIVVCDGCLLVFLFQVKFFFKYPFSASALFFSFSNIPVFELPPALAGG